tara:strand:+ start:1007 stop:1315 length:309 start_codon:yes stop_codon:yes gene_type:complete
MKKQIDYVADIMDKWYKAMEKENVGVQPKCATMLGTVLSGYKISLDTEKRDIWAEALTKRGGEFMDWYKSLTKAEQEVYHEKLTHVQAHKRDHVDNKHLLKG